MKFTICSVLLALLVKCGDPLKCDPNTAQEVRIAAGETLKEALVSENYPNNYPNNACQRWNIMAEENQCVKITTGDTYFKLKWDDDYVFVTDMGTGKKAFRSGTRLKNHFVFASDSKNVVVEFVSDDTVTMKGFKLDVKSFACLQGIVNFTETYKGSKYMLIAKLQNYEKSRQSCMDLGGDLAVITTKQKNNFISSMIAKVRHSISPTYVRDIWIGLYQKTGNNADLQWVDGTPFVINDPSWGPWRWNNPNEEGWGGVRLLANYAYMLFDDKYPSATYWALCEKSVD